MWSTHTMKRVYNTLSFRKKLHTKIHSERKRERERWETHVTSCRYCDSTHPPPIVWITNSAGSNMPFVLSTTIFMYLSSTKLCLLFPFTSSASLILVVCIFSINSCCNCSGQLFRSCRRGQTSSFRHWKAGQLIGRCCIVYETMEVCSTLTVINP